MSGVQARRPLSLHQRSPSPFLLDSIIITPNTCAPPHQIPSWSPSSVDYLDTSLPSLCLARLSTLICVSMFVHCVFLLPITFGFVRSGHQHYVAVWGVPFLIIVLFLPVGFWFNKLKKLTCIWTQTSILSTGYHAVPWQNLASTTWVQQESSPTSVREMGASRSMPGASGKSLGDRRQRRPASWSSSGGACPSPSNPGCRTGTPRSCWRTTSTWLCIWAVQRSEWSQWRHRLTKLPKRRCPFTQLPRWWRPLTDLLRRRCPPTFFAKQWISRMFPPKQRCSLTPLTKLPTRRCPPTFFAKQWISRMFPPRWRCSLTPLTKLPTRWCSPTFPSKQWNPRMFPPRQRCSLTPLTRLPTRRCPPTFFTRQWISRMFPPRWRCSLTPLTKLPTRRCPPTFFARQWISRMFPPRWRCSLTPLTKLPTRRCPPTFFARQWISRMFPPRRRCPPPQASWQSLLRIPLRSGSPRSPLRSGSPRSPLRSGSPRSPLRSGSPRSPLRSRSPRSPLRSGSPRSPFQSPLRSGSPRSPFQSPLRSGSPRSPLRSGSPRSPLRSVSQQSPFQSPLLARRPYQRRPNNWLRPGLLPCRTRPGILLWVPRPGTLGCLFLAALFHYMGLAPPSLPLLRPRSVVPLVGGLGTSGSRSFKGG